MAELYLMFFFPALVLSFTPHSKAWYFFDFFLILWLYRHLAIDIMQPAIFTTFFVAVFPALVLKAVAIILKQREHFKTARFLPILSLIGPALCLFVPDQLNAALTAVFG